MIFASAALAAAPFITLPTGYTERLTTIRTFEEVGETSAISRLHFWRVAWDMTKDNPLGVGLRNFDSMYDRYDFLDGQFGRGRAVHNSHLQALAENGFLGFAIWLFLFLSAGSTCLRLRRIADRQLGGTEDGVFVWKMASALAASMAAFVVGGTFIALALNDLTWFTFALVAALDRLTLNIVAQRQTQAQPAVHARAHGSDVIAVARR
jgi:O-antigen ligase